VFKVKPCLSILSTLLDGISHQVQAHSHPFTLSNCVQGQALLIHFEHLARRY